VTGDVYFGRNVTLRGTVIGLCPFFPHLKLFTDMAQVVANEGQRIDIPDGCILENRLLSGNLNMIVRSSLSHKTSPHLTLLLLAGIVNNTTTIEFGLLQGYDLDILLGWEAKQIYGHLVINEVFCS
jgi:hypothetical protein